MRLRLTFPALAFVMSMLSAAHALAQSTIINAPSTGVEAPKKVYVEMDFLTNYAWQQQGSFQSYAPRVVVGVARNIEVGVNVAYTHVAGQTQPIEIQPNVKWQFYSDERRGTAAAVGCILYTPITHRTGTNTLGLCYTVGSKKFNSRFGPRFTGGGYALLHANEKTKAGAIIGYEQPLVKRVAFVIDWFSGDNRFGYVSPALSFTTSKTSNLTAGYTIANHGRGKNALFAYYGIQF